MPVVPDVVKTLDEFVKSGFNGNFLNNFCGAIFCSLIPTKENVWVPEPTGNDSNSSKSAMGMNDLDLYNLIWFVLGSTSTKYADSLRPGMTVPCAV